jgi:hypothetical protein
MQEQGTLDSDLLPCDLADSDSLFTAVGAVEVHHKISTPEVSVSLLIAEGLHAMTCEKVSVIRSRPSLPKMSVSASS